MKSNKDTNTMMKPINSLTNVSLMGNFDVMSKLPFMVLFFFVVLSVWAQTDSTMVRRDSSAF